MCALDAAGAHIDLVSGSDRVLVVASFRGKPLAAGTGYSSSCALTTDASPMTRARPGGEARLGSSMRAWFAPACIVSAALACAP